MNDIVPAGQTTTDPVEPRQLAKAQGQLVKAKQKLDEGFGAVFAIGGIALMAAGVMALLLPAVFPFAPSIVLLAFGGALFGGGRCSDARAKMNLKAAMANVAALNQSAKSAATPLVPRHERGTIWRQAIENRHADAVQAPLAAEANVTAKRDNEQPTPTTPGRKRLLSGLKSKVLGHV